MEKLADIHIHILAGADDGIKNEDSMYKMLDQIYADGVRVLCCTSHFHPGYFGDNNRRVDKSFDLLNKYIASSYSDLKLYIGNELRWSKGAIEWLASGECRTLNGTRNVLVDFLEYEEPGTILNASLSLLNSGYYPVIAHAERYEKLHRNFREILQMKEYGAIIQIDADSVFGEWSGGAKHRAKGMLKAGIADIVASDAHDIVKRPSRLKEAYEYSVHHYGPAYSKELFWENPISVLEK